jgi:hypothetical protein
VGYTDVHYTFKDTCSLADVDVAITFCTFVAIVFISFMIILLLVCLPRALPGGKQSTTQGGIAHGDDLARRRSAPTHGVTDSTPLQIRANGTPESVNRY